MHHVLIRDDSLEQYRRIEPADELEVCWDGDLYRVVRDPAREVCMVDRDGWRLCNFPVPHDHPSRPIYQGDTEDQMAQQTRIGTILR